MIPNEFIIDTQHSIIRADKEIRLSGSNDQLLAGFKLLESTAGQVELDEWQKIRESRFEKVDAILWENLWHSYYVARTFGTFLTFPLLELKKADIGRGLLHLFFYAKEANLRPLEVEKNKVFIQGKKTQKSELDDILEFLGFDVEYL